MAGLVLVQPDLGNSLALVVLTFGVLYMAGARLKHLAWIAAAGAARGGAGRLRWRRTGCGACSPSWIPGRPARQRLPDHPVVPGPRARAACSGAGSADSKQKLFYLPEPHTDFIFAIMGEELGFLGAVAHGRAVRACSSGAACASGCGRRRVRRHLALGLTRAAGHPDPGEPRRGDGRCCRPRACRCRSSPSAARRCW